MTRQLSAFLTRFVAILLAVFIAMPAFAGDEDFPPRPNPPRLVNDLAGMLDASQREMLEAKLLEYEKTSSTQITIVTLTSIGSYEPSQYGVELFNRWGVGQKGKDNGVLILASKEDRKINITTGYGLEGALPDAVAGRIIRNEMAPSFKAGNYYDGFSKAADAVIAATKGEYTNDDKEHEGRGRPSAITIVLMIIGVYVVLWILSKIGGGGGGSYMSGRGYRGWGNSGGGWFVGGGGFGGGSGWGGGSSGGGGFGGFGGGSSGGGGASGSW